MSKRVLVVEDYTEARQALIKTLHGYDCIEAATVADALAAVEANPAPALVILDLRLDAPVAELHATLDRLGIPVIVVSGLATAEVQSAAEAHPGWRWMTKPVDGAALRQMVAQIVESPAVSNEIEKNNNSQYPERVVDNLPVSGPDVIRDRIRVVMDRLLYAAGLGVMAYLAKIGRLDLGNATAVMLVVGVRPHNLFEMVNGRNGNRASFMLMLGVMGDSLRSGNWLAS